MNIYKTNLWYVIWINTILKRDKGPYPTHTYLSFFFPIHSPHEIINTAGKTSHNSRRKRNQSWNLFIHISNKSASIKTKDIPIESSKLLCFSFILFYSKSCLLKTFPAVISRVFIFVINRPSKKTLDVKWSQLRWMFTCFNPMLVWNKSKEGLLPLAGKERRWRRQVTRTVPLNSR